jgi:hypothetical protein
LPEDKARVDQAAGRADIPLRPGERGSAEGESLLGFSSGDEGVAATASVFVPEENGTIAAVEAH